MPQPFHRTCRCLTVALPGKYTVVWKGKRFHAKCMEDLPEWEEIKQAWFSQQNEAAKQCLLERIAKRDGVEPEVVLRRNGIGTRFGEEQVAV